MSKDKRKIYLKGMHPFFAVFFYGIILIAIILEIFSHQIPGVYSLGLWLLLLIGEVAGIARKSGGKDADTLSESWWLASEGYSTRRRMIAWFGIGVGAKIGSFAFMYPKGGNLFTDLPWAGDWFILSKAFLIFVVIGFCHWIFDHMLLRGRDG